MSWAGRRVLVTGHTGFKGGWLSLWLSRLGAEVTGFAGAPPTDPSLFELARIGDAVEDVRGDVRDPSAVDAAVARARPEVVFHLAAQPLVLRAHRDPVETMGTNVLGTVHVLDAVRRTGTAGAVVVVTSDKCYAPRADHTHTEEDALGGAEPYSASKAAQELVAASFRDAYDLPIATARAGNVIGGGDWAEDRLLPDLVRAATTSGALLVRNPAHVRPWQHVLNPLAGYLALAERLISGEDVASGWNFGPAAEDERPVSWVVERFRSLWPGPLTVETAGSPAVTAETPSLRLDSTRARRRLGWVPHWDLAAGLAATVDWHARVLAGDDSRELALAQIERYAGESDASLPAA